MARRSPTLRALAAFALLATPLVAQNPRGTARDTAGSTRVDPRSPRAAIGEFLSLTRRGQFDAAAQFMGPGVSPARGAELAQHLKAVFDQRLWIDLDDVSPLAAGDTLDGLRDDREQIGMIANDIGVRQPVQLERMRPGAEPAWVFDPRTVSRIDQWYGALENRWLRDHMPVALQRAGPFGIELWQWVTLAFLIPFAFVVGWLLARATVWIVRRGARRMDAVLDDRVMRRLGAPLVAIWSIVAYRTLVEFVGLSIGATRVTDLLARAFVVAFVTWVFIRATHVLEKEIPSTRWADKPEMRAMLPLLGRVVRALILAIGAIVLVAQFGYSVATLITGLGIGGIAVALAMQKTLEHIFGSIAIGLDQPIRVGDWVKVGDTEGEVAAIGLRSTRLRTVERSVVAIPNGRLSEMQMENFGVRDRILLRANIALAYGTSVDQVRRVRDDVEALLREHPLVWPGAIIVRFKGFGVLALDIEVMCWMSTTDFDVFRAAREEVLFRIMEFVQRAGTDFAYPIDRRHI